MLQTEKSMAFDGFSSFLHDSKGGPPHEMLLRNVSNGRLGPLNVWYVCQNLVTRSSLQACSRPNFRSRLMVSQAFHTIPKVDPLTKSRLETFPMVAWVPWMLGMGQRIWSRNELKVTKGKTHVVGEV